MAWRKTQAKIHNIDGHLFHLLVKLFPDLALGPDAIWGG
jgi:hypothetical protein